MSQASRIWLVKWLDGLLSEPLRQAPPADLARARVMAGTTCVLGLFSALYLLIVQLSPSLESTSAPRSG